MMGEAEWVGRREEEARGPLLRFSGGVGERGMGILEHTIVGSFCHGLMCR